MKITPGQGTQQTIVAQTTNNTPNRAAAIAKLSEGMQAKPEPMQQPLAQQAAIEEVVQQQPNAPETQPEAAQQPTEAEIQASKRFIALAKQEKALRAQKAELDRKQKEWDAKQSQVPQQTQLDPTKYVSRDELKANALQILADSGISYEELTQQLLSQPTVDPRVESQFNELKAEIQRLKEENENSKKQSVDKETEAYQRAVTQISNDVKLLVAKDAAFETIKSLGAQKDVVDLIEQTYKDEGVLLTVQEACEMTEDFLVDEYTKILTKNSKLKQRLAQSDASKEQANSVKTSSENQPQQPQIKTLTNSIGSSRQLSARERAILAARGELK